LFWVDNKETDALSLVVNLLQVMSTKVISFDKVKDTYPNYLDFDSIYLEVSQDNHRPLTDFVIHDGYLFKETKLCMPWTSFKDFLI